MINWKVKMTTKEATQDVASLFEDEDVKVEVMRILGVLAKQEDPRSPRLDSGLIVDEMEHHAPGWFRVKVPRFAIRIVFQLLVVDEERLIPIKRLEPVPDDGEEGYIDIMQARYRSDAHGEALRRRHRKYSDQDSD